MGGRTRVMFGMYKRHGCIMSNEKCLVTQVANGMWANQYVHPRVLVSNIIK